MGCKDVQATLDALLEADLIETYWDVKVLLTLSLPTADILDLIETYWDVKNATMLKKSACCPI